MINSTPPDKVYDVTITIHNTNNSDSGINFEWYRLIRVNMILDLNYALYMMANPAVQDSLHIALRQDTEMEFHLPFNLKQEQFQNKNWNNLNNIPFQLVVSLYPNQKRINVIQR